MKAPTPGVSPARASSRFWRGPLGVACLLVSMGVGPAQPARAPDASQQVRGVTLRVYESSQLVAADAERLELVPGRTLAPEAPAAAAVALQLRRALDSLPPLPFERPLQVHLDPRLPPGQAALGGLEVHVSSRALLITRSALAAAATSAWRHELLHALAAAPPEHGPSGARHLWLALEEGLVQYLAGAPEAERAPPELPPHAEHAVPYWAEALASPGYDPHPLAAQLAGALRDIDPRPDLLAWLPCLVAPPGHAAMSLAELPRRFAERCPAGAASRLRQALGARVPLAGHAAAGKAAARAAESL